MTPDQDGWCYWKPGDPKPDADAICDVARSLAVETHETPWRAGVSQGSVFGELMGVMDVDGGRKFYIRPPSGPPQIQCVFKEDLREQMVKNLFGVVRATGMLHYDGKSAHPYLLEAEGAGKITRAQAFRGY